MTISIDDDFARFGSKSYAINKVNSVEVRAGPASGRLGAIVWSVLAAFFGLVTIVGLAAPDRVIGAVLFLAGLTALFAWRAVAGFKRAGRRDYFLVLTTSSAEAQAFTSTDEHEVIALRDQIEAAMARSARPR